MINKDLQSKIFFIKFKNYGETSTDIGKFDEKGTSD